jgi:hypothetical protein
MKAAHGEASAMLRALTSTTRSTTLVQHSTVRDEHARTAATRVVTPGVVTQSAARRRATRTSSNGSTDHASIVSCPQDTAAPVLRPARDDLGDVGPLVPERVVGLDQHLLLVHAPRRLLDVRPQVVVPPLAALLPDAPLVRQLARRDVELPRDRAPVALAVLFDEPAAGGRPWKV